jgi:hypothetical protein
LEFGSKNDVVGSAELSSSPGERVTRCSELSRKPDLLFSCFSTPVTFPTLGKLFQTPIVSLLSFWGDDSISLILVNSQIHFSFILVQEH